MKYNIFVVLLLLAVFTEGFSFVGWNPTLGGRFIQLVLYALMLYSVANINRINHYHMNLKPLLLCFMLIPFLSVIPALMIHGQDVSSSFYSTKKNFLYLMFFLPFLLKIKEEDMLKLFLYLGVAWCVVEIVQQLTFPKVWFAVRTATDEVEVEIRNGIYRYNTVGREFGLIMLFYSFVQYMKNRKGIFLFGFVLGLAGIYILATRQVMVAAALCLLYGMFSLGKMKLSSFLCIVVVFAVIYLNMDVLFGEYIEKTTNDLTEDNVRLVSYEFYGIRYNEGDFLRILLGNGDPGRYTSYANEISKFEDYGLFRADIGIVGMYSLYGIVYVICVIMFFAFCFYKRRYIDLYLKMYIVFMLVTSVMLWHFGYSYERISIMSCIFFLIDKSISRNKSLQSKQSNLCA